MEVDEIQALSRRGVHSNGKIDSKRTVFCDEEVAEGEIRRQRNKEDGDRGRVSARGGGVGGGGATLDFTAGVGGLGRVCGWPSSRIVRVSRASGGKDRHSKVLTSKGLRDRRVRLSVNTAIQFYDLQDRLGYDQPSKAVDWLLKAASDSISELPPISTPFPGTPKQQQLSDTEKRSSGGGGGGGGKGDVEMEGGGGEGEPHEGKLSKSAGSSNSETSKGSVGGLSRSESRLKAREHARERAAKERERAAKERESENTAFDVVQQQHQKHHRNISSMPQNATFTELLSSGFAGTNTNAVNHHSNNNSPNGSGGGGGIHESNFFQKPPNNWSATPMDYFGGTGLLVPSTTSRSTNNFSGQIQLGNNSMQQALSTHVSSPFFTVSGDTHQELHSFSLIPEQYVNNNHHNESYNLNFSISSTTSSGFNRGTLQSNSSTLPQIQRFSSTDNNGSSPSGFFLGAAPPPHAAAVGSHQQQHHFQPSAFDAGLQLFYGDGSSHADHKGKGKS